MDTNDSNRNETKHNGERRPYVAPAIEDTAVFETLAAGCGRLAGEPVPACIANPSQ